MEPARVKIGEKEYPVLFGIVSIREYAMLQGQTFDQAVLDMKNILQDTENSIKLMYCGLVYGHKKINKQVSFDLDGFWMMLDEDMDAMARLIDVFANQYGRQDTKKKDQESH